MKRVRLFSKVDSNSSISMAGQVIVDKLPGRFSKNPDGTPKKWPDKEGFKRINVCSGAPGKWKQLSPMLLGPIDTDAWGWKDDDTGERLRGVKRVRYAQNLENLWYGATSLPCE
jgi:hypothetical protein